MPKKVLVLLADGFEEVEAVTPIDYLRRAGLDVTSAAIGKDRLVAGSRGISVTADTTLAELAKTGRAGASAWDAVLLPGGGRGAANLAASPETGALLKDMAVAGKWIAAICASPAVVLAPLGLLAGRRFTCFPGMEANVSGAKWTEDPVAADGNIITSRGAGTAGRWAVEIIGRLLGPAEGEKVARSVLL
ncbi:MAG: DJ-1/PfpI family protein [Treponema sp.]|jgi:4-methyl-5(b-hydroxyethyl)-thiazole monophosphate biosynthesis|nr:DJ-1/PfpI family protein [Treponema sp.]